MAAPTPTPILRLIHLDNLDTCLRRTGLHAANHIPNDGLPWKCIHDPAVQAKRGSVQIPCGPGGVALDYVPFYFGFLSPMHLQLKTGQVPGYNDGQEPLIYLVSNCQKVEASGTRFVFSDGHGLATYTDWFSDLSELGKVDWAVVNKRYWTGNAEKDMDLQRRKQAEFLVHRFCDWSLIDGIVVIDQTVKAKVEQVLSRFDQRSRRVVTIRKNWYYH
jgi:hypothetical protein